jgi:uncharacterized coiled-coil DUF342 family protein
MTELLSELEEKRAKANNEAEKHRNLRDDLNSETRSWMGKRDDLNAKVRETINNANGHRETRDKLNTEVRETKSQRDLWNRTVSELSEKLMQEKREKMPQGGFPIRKLKMEMRALEKRHMTSVLTPDKERALVDEIGTLSSKIQAMEKEFDGLDEIRKLDKDLKDAKKNAEAAHRKVGDLAERAQVEHDEMVKLFDEADKLRSEADQAQDKFVETKLKADEEHRSHIEFIRQVHDYDKIISGMRQKLRKTKKDKEDDSAKKESEDIFEKFKSGEKLSTDDLMILQKSGYL